MTNPATNSTMTPRNWAELLLLGAIWGGAFFFARIAVAEIAPLHLVFLRVAFAALALHIYLLARGTPFNVDRRLALQLAILSVLNNVIPFSLIFSGQVHLGAGLASIINATTPFWTIIAANALTSDEKISWNKLVGTLAGIAGTVLLIGPEALGNVAGPLWAKLSILGAALSYAFAAIHAKRLRHVAPATIAAGQLTASCVLLLPVGLAFAVSGGPALISGHVWASVIALAGISTAFAYILYFRLIGSAGATNASLVTLVIPASAILLGALFLSERLTYFDAGGLSLITIGLIVIDGRLLARR